MTGQLASVGTAMTRVPRSDNFEGAAQRSMSGYVQHVHVDATRTLTRNVEDLIREFDHLITAFKSGVDSSDSAIIDTDYLQSQKAKLSALRAELARGISKGNAGCSEASGLASVTRLRQTAPTEIEDAERKLSQASQKLASFNGMSPSSRMKDITVESARVGGNIRISGGSKSGQVFMEGLSYATGAIAIGGSERRKKRVALRKIKPTSKSKKNAQKRISPNDMKGTKVMESGVAPSSILLRIEKATGLNKLQKKKLVQEIERYGVDAVADFAKSKAKSKVIDKALQGAHQWFERNTTVFMNRGLVAETTNGLEHTIEATPGPLTEMTRFGLTKGAPAIGGLMDYNSMRVHGSNTLDAGVKATAHVGIGLESAQIGAAIGTLLAPGLGTVVGTAAGIGVGFIVNKIADNGFDHLYDGLKARIGRLGTSKKGHKGLGRL